jgi:hypothetical protein
MNASLQKETRLLLPAWGLAMCAVVIPACLPGSEPAGIALPCFAVGALLLALAPFGQEISLGTFSLLLAQPQTRLRLWRMKLGLAATALLSVWTVLAVLWIAPAHGSPASRNLVELCGLVALAVLAGAFWTTLLFRQSIAAFWASLLLPWLLCALWPMPPDPNLQMTPARAVAVPLILYAAAGLAFARWLLLRVQDMPWTGGVVSLARLRAGGWSFSLLTPQKRQWCWLALLQKEIALQQVTLFLVPCLVLLHVLALVARVINPEFAKGSVPISSIWVLWMAGPFVVGSVAVAEERRLHTMAHVLCLPVPRFLQFLLKFGVVLVVGIFLGAAMPWLLEDLGQLFGARNELANWTGLPSLFIAAGAVGTVSFFASTLGRNSLHALGTGFVLSTVVFLYILGGGLHYPLKAIYLGNPLLRAAFGPVMLLALVWPAYANFRRIDLHFAWLSNLAIWLATVIVLMAAAVGIYFRPWELALPLEPRHGPARLGVSPDLRICATFARVFVLLPNGRLWQCPVLGWMGQPVPSVALSGFVSGTNWAIVAANYGNAALATQTDGSLWSISDAAGSRLQAGSLTVERVGFESDWKSVAVGNQGFFAIKQQGSLWQLSGGKVRTMARLGQQSDWTEIFGVATGIIAVEQNGSVWPWTLERDGNWKKQAKLRFTGTNWAAFAWVNFPQPLALDKEGNIWATDSEWNYFIHDAKLSRMNSAPPQVAAHAGFRALDGNWQVLGRVDSAARLWTQPAQRSGSPEWALLEQTPHQPSKYSDWLAVTTRYGSLVALAEDGTLSSWHMPNQWEDQNSLLAPPRKPEWSVNLFEHAR